MADQVNEQPTNTAGLTAPEHTNAPDPRVDVLADALAMPSQERFEQIEHAYYKGYHSVWRTGGDLGDHEEAVREGLWHALREFVGAGA